MKLARASVVGMENRRAVGATAERKTSLIFMKVPRDILKNDCSIYLKILLYMSFAFNSSSKVRTLLESLSCMCLRIAVKAAIETLRTRNIKPIEEIIGERSL